MHLPDTRPIYISSRLSTTTPTAAPPRHRWEAPTAMRRVARRGGVVHLRVGGGRFVSLAGARCTTPPRPRFFVIHARADITATLFGRVRARTPQRRRRAAYDSRIRPASARAPIWTTQGPVGIESIIKGF